MTVRPFDAAALADHTVVVLIPATSDHTWASRRAWEIARQAAGQKPRVALVDLSISRPTLNEGADQWAEEGIVDALLDDVSLTQVAQPQNEPGLHYLAVGRPTNAPQDVWGHERWNRLAAGFQSQGAMLLLYTPPGAVPHASFRPDAVVILARSGWDRATGGYQGVTNWLDAGVPLLGVVSDPEPPRAPAGEFRWPGEQAEAWGWRGWVAAAVVVIVLAALGWGAVRLIRSRGAEAEGGGEADPAAAAPVPEDTAAAAPAAPPPEPDPGDSLFYSVQVAAFNTWDRALEYATSLETGRLAAAITPIRIGGGVWYRVLLGALPTAAEAEAVLQGLWRDGLVAGGEGAILRTPEAFDLGTRESSDAARAEADRLRALGVPAYSLDAPGGGRARIFVGAFETPDQTAVVESLMTVAGVTATLMTRTGTAR